MKYFTINKFWSVSALLLGLGFGLSAQSLISLDGDLTFSSTDELQASTQTLRLYNPNSYPIQIVGVDRFSIYGDKVFSVSDSVFTVLPADTFSLNVSFLPEHNILHQQALVFISSSGFGHTAVGLTGQGTYSKSYYSLTENKSQEALKTALSSRLALGYNDLGYTGARDQMYASIDNNGGQVECVYTGRTATFNTRAGANTNSFNCEHTFPQGFFNSNVPMRSDIHHLFPTDVTANSRRGNDPFGVVSTASWSQGGSKSGGGKFEPRNVHKGAVARAMMYFVIRYQDYSNHFSGQESILRQWHEQYPPTAAERARNVAIFNLQNNRNPFVDYPQFIERISDIDGTAQATDTDALYHSDDTIFLAQGNSGLRTFHFVLYGSGSTTANATNFSLSDPNLSFKQGNPNSVSLDQGDYFDLEIEFETGQQYNAQLSYEVFGNTVVVPIVSGPGLSLTEADISLADIYPNPSEGSVNIDHPELIKSLRLIDASGKEWVIEPHTRIDLSFMPKGLYTWRVELKEQSFTYFQRIILN
jgi:hypothetical protein